VGSEEGIDREVMTAEEAAGYLRIAVATLYRLVNAGKVPGVRVGRLWRFRRSQLDGWLEQQMQANVVVSGEKGAPRGGETPAGRGDERGA
jgi:excisionase family DNA binding protein